MSCSPQLRHAQPVPPSNGLRIPQASHCRELCGLSNVHAGHDHSTVVADFDTLDFFVRESDTVGTAGRFDPDECEGVLLAGVLDVVTDLDFEGPAAAFDEAL